VKLRKIEIKNFKLLKDVAIDFSTDPAQPLTVVRAENGSGKTSLLYALLWGFYGNKGISDTTSELRLSSTHWPPGSTCDISVRIEFESSDVDTFAGEETTVSTRYVLTRSVTETPGEGNAVSRQRDELTVHSYSDAGAEKLEDAAARALIRRLAPDQMKDIFFTDGDAVQRFITGELGAKARQTAVHDAIKSLLGLDSLRVAATDLSKARTTFKRRLAEAPGAEELKRIDTEIEEATNEQQELSEQASTLTERINNVTEAIERRQARLYELKDLGDIERIKKQRDTAQSTLDTAQVQLDAQKKTHRELMRSERLSWALMGETLSKGMAALEALADTGIIPGTSIEVLRDRLQIGTCICGEQLHEGSTHRAHIEQLLDEQTRVDPNKERLTALLHQARPRHIEHEQAVVEGTTWIDGLTEVETLRAGVEKQIRDQGDALKECEEALRRLEDAEVDRLLEALDRDRKQREGFLGEQRVLSLRQEDVQKRLVTLNERYQKAKSQVKVSTELQDKVDVTDDLVRLVQQTLETLEGEYLGRASARMNQLFMEIAGSTPEVATSVFNEVRITSDYEIEVLSGGYGRTLDPDFEVNGASKRALTLSFIWALMEVAEVPAPRIIDTPLGMTSGGVKRRFVDLLTKPGEQELQIILFMTRSEISHVESLIDERAGIVQTISCSKDYPVDLVNDWGGDEPAVVVCECTHREACTVCARHDDNAHQLAYRG
jgi:DNA sulfur modification protein DndD